MLHLILHADKV